MNDLLHRISNINISVDPLNVQNSDIIDWFIDSLYIFYQSIYKCNWKVTASVVFNFHFEVGVQTRQKWSRLRTLQRVNTRCLFPQRKRALSKQQSSSCLFQRRAVRWCNAEMGKPTAACILILILILGAWSCSSAPPANTYRNLRNLSP